MPQAGTVHIRGWREVSASLNKIQRGAYKKVLGGLERAAEPVRASWVNKLSGYSGASTATIRPKVLAKGIIVRQDARKVTGRRADFGSLQMRHGLSALFERQDETRREAEKALDELISEEGF